MKYPSSKKKILFLYTELAGYFIACLKKLREEYDVDIVVIHWNINKDAPFRFSLPPEIEFINKESIGGKKLKKKIEEINPDLIYCSGWVDRDYVRIAKKFKGRIPTVFCLDNPWVGSIKQRIACLISRFTIKRAFLYCWVPGERQKDYARRLGFSNNFILNRYYSADVNYFMEIGLKHQSLKQSNFPHRFIYAGRYADFKGVGDLWKGFIEWKNETKNNWELWCLGTGEFPTIEHPSIKHFGFIQPTDMDYYMGETGVFILPSRFEPWGVVLHEFCSAGFPIICTDVVGSSEVFVENGVNGYVYHAGDIDELKKCFNKMASQSDKALIEMGNVSRNLAKKITPALWAKTLMGLLENKR